MSKPHGLDLDKEDWRAVNYDFILDPQFGMIENGLLRCSYYELLGYSGYRFYELIKGHLQDPKDFIGADTDFKVIASQVFKRVGFRPVFSKEGYAWAATLCTTKKPPRPVGIFNFDDTKEVGHPYWDSRWGFIVRNIVGPTIDNLGFCAVILNATGSGPDIKQALRRHAEFLIKHMKAFGWSGPATEVQDLLGDPLDLDRLDDYSWKGNIGSFEVYKSKGKHLRMVTIRLFFRGTDHQAIAYKAR